MRRSVGGVSLVGMTVGGDGLLGSFESLFGHGDSWRVVMSTEVCVCRYISTVLQERSVWEPKVTRRGRRQVWVVVFTQ